MTFVGLNGIYSSNNSDRYMEYSEDGFNIIEKSPRNITIGIDNNHVIENPKFMMGMNQEFGPYYGYKNLGQSCMVPIGVPILLTISSSDFHDTQIYDENGNTITVNGYNVNSNIYTHIRFNYIADNTPYYIILPYAEPAHCLIQNYSDHNIFIYSRGVGNNSKNIYINEKTGYRNSGRWRFELGQTDEVLWLIGDRDGWQNLSLYDH